MVINFIILRVQQLRRILGSVNIVYQLFLVALIILVITGISVQSSQSQGNLLLPIAHLVLIVSFHWYRPDIHFLKAHFEKYKFVCLIEYLILSTPLLIGLAISPSFYYLFPYIVSLLALVHTSRPIPNATKVTRSLNFIPAQYFEWKSWLRKFFYPILILWIVGMVFSFQMGVGIIAIFLIGLISLGCYDHCESVSILTASQQNTKSFFATRVKGIINFSAGLYMPIFSLFCIFHPAHWYIPLIIILVLLSYQFYALCIKYAFYEPQARSSRNTALLSLGALVFVLPFMLPAIWVLSIKLYSRAIKKLNFYLHDFN